MTEQEQPDLGEQPHPEAAPGGQPEGEPVEEIDGEGWSTPGARQPAGEVVGSDAETEPQPIPVQRQQASPEAPAGPPPAPEGNAFGAVGSLLANLGVKDRRAQQWVAIGGAVLIFLCCSCACIIPLLSLFADQ